MDDSDLDFVDLCSKLLKRVRKKPGEAKPEQKAEHNPSSQSCAGNKRRRNNKKDGDCGSKVTGKQPVSAGAGQPAVSGGTGCDSEDAGSLSVPAVAGAAGPGTQRGLTAKEKVLLKMHQFRRASPHRLVHRDEKQSANQENDCELQTHPQRQDLPQPCSSGLRSDSDEDEALALQLQQEMDREAAEAETENLEDRGLFFCQICHRDLSHMTPEGRTQHLNRCLDKSEESAPPPPSAAPPSVPDCPICGKKLKSQKSRLAHLKRCSSDLAVPPAVLLQAIQRQAEETQNVPTANTFTQSGGTKRKGLPKPGLPVRKKPKKNADPLDEDTMVALALSSSLLEQERETQRELKTLTAASHASPTSVLKWKPHTGKVRGKKKKGAVPCPPPLLLVQDAQAAQARLQERVAALLLQSRPPSPPTPTLCPSSLRDWSSAAPLWQKSALLNSSSTCLSDFYTAELREFITPWETAKSNAASASTSSEPKSCPQSVTEETPVTGTRNSSLPSSSQTASSSLTRSIKETRELPVGSQALQDLIVLAEDGMTLTQYRVAASGLDKNRQSSASQSSVHLSGFVLEDAEEHAEQTEDTHQQAGRRTDQQRGDKNPFNHQSVALSRLASDLSGMVNNPQLSDVQLQVDSGEIYFAHSFMVYARCPLLAEMVHESGFGVQEEDLPAGQRVLVSDVPGLAVFTLLQYLYTAQCTIPASMQPHMLELASRFDLQELRQLCEIQHDHEARIQGDEADFVNQDEKLSDQTDQVFAELLHSMWNEETEEDDGTDTDGEKNKDRQFEEDCQTDDVTSGEREIREEQVNEEELEEIYEFAATQRKREEEDSIEEEEEEEEKVAKKEVITELTEPKTDISKKTLRPSSRLESEMSLDRSYNRLFSDTWGVYEEKDPSPSTSGTPKIHTSQSQKCSSSNKPSCKHSSRTFLHLSQSIEDESSTSPSPGISNLPVAGLSPGQVGSCRGDGDEGIEHVKLDISKECLSLKRESRGPRSICVPVPPDSLSKKTEPELIVLSDSSEELEAVVFSPSSHSPCTGLKPQSKSPSNTQPTGPIMENKVSSSLELSPGNSPAPLVLSHPSSSRDQSPVNGSLEVSWLIPSTPVQSGGCTRNSSTQTKSSMCRTQLFPKGDASSHSSHFSSPSPARPPLDSNSATRVSTQPASRGSGLDLNFSPKRTSSCDSSKNREVSAVLSHHPKLLHPSTLTHCQHPKASLTQDSPQPAQLLPYSSTPLHTDLHQPSALLAASPLNCNHNRERSPSREDDRASSGSICEKTEIGSFHLSPLSDPSDPPSSLSNRGRHSSQKHKTSHESQSSAELIGFKHTGADLQGREIRRETDTELRNKDLMEVDDGDKEDTKDSGEAEASFHQSFMDEPPIAFNDSWGLDACVDANPGCFSLRLEDSGASSPQERSPGQREASRSSSVGCHPSPSSHRIRSSKSCTSVFNSSPSKGHTAQPTTSIQAHRSPSFTPPPPEPNNSLLNSKIWDSWAEEEEEALPLSQRVKPSAKPRTPASSRQKKRCSMVPITPMPHYSDMDTPELKNKLNRFGVRPLPKRQMILKLKEIHHYTHQLVSSGSEDEAPSAGCAAHTKPRPSTSSGAAGSRTVSCGQTVKFKEPRAPTANSPLKHRGEEAGELLSASQGSNTSSTAASEESERSNPELCVSSDGDSDSDGGMPASQAATRLLDRLQAVRSFILSDPTLYSKILQYQPLVLSQLQGQLKAAGIRLGAAKLVDYLDSQCITFTTAKPGQSAPSRRKTKVQGVRGANRKKVAS